MGTWDDGRGEYLKEAESRMRRDIEVTTAEQFDESLKRQIQENGYTTYALTKKGRQEIECYATVQGAIQDTLDIWPEDAGERACDISLVDKDGTTVVYFARSIENPLIAHVYFMGSSPNTAQHYESYKCHYEPALGGSVRTVVKRLG